MQTSRWLQSVTAGIILYFLYSNNNEPCTLHSLIEGLTSHISCSQSPATFTIRLRLHRQHRPPFASLPPTTRHHMNVWIPHRETTANSRLSCSTAHVLSSRSIDQSIFVYYGMTKCRWSPPESVSNSRAKITTANSLCNMQYAYILYRTGHMESRCSLGG